jgi:hypothetical protein
VSGTITSTDRGSGRQTTALTRDFNSTSNGTFEVAVANGTYSVTITMGDAKTGHDNMNVYLDGTLFGSNLSTTSGQFITKTYTVTVSNGMLVLQLVDTGGSGHYAVINALQFTKMGGLHADTAPGFLAPVSGSATPAHASDAARINHHAASTPYAARHSARAKHRLG